MRRGLRHDPKVIVMSRELAGRRDFMDWWSDPVRVTCNDNVTEIVTFANVTRVTVCALLDVWAALNNTLKGDGKAPFMTLQDIDDIAEIPGFGEAMALVGWVIELDDGSIEFPNFSEHNSPAKSRDGEAKTGAQRAKEFRDRKRAEKASAPTVTASRNVTVEKRREEKNILSSKEDNNDLPFQSSDFVLFWNNWKQHRKEKKQPLTPTARKQQLENLKAMGEKRAIAALKHSMANGWLGIFEPKDDLFDANNHSKPRTFLDRNPNQSHLEPDEENPL